MTKLSPSFKKRLEKELHYRGILLNPSPHVNPFNHSVVNCSECGAEFSHTVQGAWEYAYHWWKYHLQEAMLPENQRPLVNYRL